MLQMVSSKEDELGENLLKSALTAGAWDGLEVDDGGSDGIVDERLYIEVGSVE